jgi:hypothetical protein
MKLYLDDDAEERLLSTLLRAAGHNVQIPRDVSLAGKPDAIHLAHTIMDARVLVTGNQDDFRNLHDLVLTSGGHHPGILVICKENDRSRDMSPRAIVRAIANLDATGFDLQDHFDILNHWRS